MSLLLLFQSSSSVVIVTTSDPPPIGGNMLLDTPKMSFSILLDSPRTSILQETAKATSSREYGVLEENNTEYNQAGYTYNETGWTYGGSDTVHDAPPSGDLETVIPKIV